MFGARSITSRVPPPTRRDAILELKRIRIMRFLPLLQRRARLGGFAEVLANSAKLVSRAGCGAVLERRFVCDEVYDVRGAS